MFQSQHILSIATMGMGDIDFILREAQYIDKQPNYYHDAMHREVNSGKKTQINLFIENSTRTARSFELAGKKLGLDVIDLAPNASSFSKGETLLDTALTLQAMNPSILVLRHPESGAAHFLSQKLHDCAVINGGDGTHEHPSQALLDLATIYKFKNPDVRGLNIAICGDIAHSRVARSNIELLRQKGANLRLIAPKTLMPRLPNYPNVQIFTDMNKGLAGADVIMMLRLQLERMSNNFIPSLAEYYQYYGLTQQRLKIADSEVKVMHPGPMNRGVEIESAVADSLENSLILQQVEMGVKVRMAIIYALLSRKSMFEYMPK